jgi:hypothetical protein
MTTSRIFAAMTPNQILAALMALSATLALASWGAVFKPFVRNKVQTGKVPTGRSALQKIAHAITLTLGRITFAVLHSFERIGVNMSAVDDAIAAWTQYATDQKAHLQDLQTQLETAQQTNRDLLATDAAQDADQALALQAQIADQISAALNSVKNPPQPPTPVSTDGNTTPAPEPVVDTGDPITNPAPTPVTSGDSTTAGEVAADDPSTPVVPTAGVGDDGSINAGVQPVPAGDLPPATPVTPVTSDPSVEGTTPTVTPSPLDPNAPADSDSGAPAADPAPVTAPVNPEDSASAAGADGNADPAAGTTPVDTSADTAGGSLASADPAVGASTNPLPTRALRKP